MGPNTSFSFYCQTGFCRCGAAEEHKRSAGEELTQYDYSKIETVISNCKFRLTVYPINRA
jgi:hypothetical protein